ncbi:prolyl 3-hydroxylase 2 [Podospora australis]|uniref:Prolyl 3-hydroxylase 2 n=1 Tax=Podospora australis TaxID=1536484 RepID=A0AAN6X214_9PEZI|nr:prolyl 3-hydroxylase 2 [Podospora australis]
MFDAIKAAIRPPPPPVKEHPTIKPNIPIKTSYTANPVTIPDGFLVEDAPDTKPIEFKPIEWETTPIPENKGLYAVILENVLSPSECETLIKLAESSVPEDAINARGGPNGEDPWGPALVNVGMGYEVLTPEYRNSDRIVWDSTEIANRLWERCCKVPGLKERLTLLEKDDKAIAGRSGRIRRGEEGKWRLVRVNERLRFLRYGKGEFFKPHCDGSYYELNDEAVIKTLFTIHIYLNDSQAEVGKDKADLVGGATTMFSSDEKRRFDVHPRAGRVLIFQHQNILHSGDEVKAGVKFSVRTDILYGLVRDELKEED